VTTSNSSDEPLDNPFEAYVDSDAGGARFESDNRSDSEDRRAQMPPIEMSYWLGFLVLMGLVGVFSYGYYPFSMSWTLAILTCWWTPFVLLRLVVHRWNIARAIEMDKYPGTQRFGLWYLISSVFVCWLCLLSGGVLFFGVCTIAVMSAQGSKTGGDNAVWMLTIGDGFLSLLFAGFLFYRGIPKYE